MTAPEVKEAEEPSSEQEEPAPPEQEEETEIKCTLCGLRACWTSS